MLTTILAAAVAALITGIITFAIQERRLKVEARRASMEVRTEIMAREAVKRLLEDKGWERRSFDAIQNRLGGFEGDELRKVLVGAGAVRFKSKDGTELWGLIERNHDDL